MTDVPPRASRQPKLRASCDSCGATKLKCDRARPRCGRCLRLDSPCVYGVSRKMGKPRRGRPRIPEVQSEPRTPDEHADSINGDRTDDNTCSNGVDGDVLISGPFPSINDVPQAWDAVDGYPDSLGISIPDLMSLDFDNNLLSSDLDTGPTSTLEYFQSEDYSTPPVQTKISQTQIGKSIQLPYAGSKGHDCSREANDILGNLSLLNPNIAHSVPRSSPGSASTTATIGHRVPFDHILRLNRESSERLGRLLTCSCARYPHHTLLCASIISLILIRYQEAADGTQRAPWSPATVAADTASSHVPSSGSMSASSSPWSSTAVSTVSTGAASTPTYSGGTTVSVAPAQIAMGSFNIDDHQVQTALTIQLLLGEIRRAGSLVDLFTSCSSSGIDEFSLSSIDSLHKSLSSWLRREHSRIADVMRSRLKEVCT